MTKVIKTNELEKVSGGSFIPNCYTKIEYATCGITVIDHVIAPDEFWWQGGRITCSDADRVMKFAIDHGRQPFSLSEARNYCSSIHKGIKYRKS